MDVGEVATLASLERQQEICFREDLDSHEDTCCVGYGVLVVHQTENTLQVTALLKLLG
jgi:hypothetical protein